MWNPSCGEVCPNFYYYVVVYHDDETGDYGVMIEEPDAPTALFTSRAQWDAFIHPSMTFKEAMSLAQAMDDFYKATAPLNRRVEFDIIANDDGTYSVLAIDTQESWIVTRADLESWKD